MRVFRLSRKRYSNMPSGNGAALRGGRWNSKGMEVLYSSSCRALALVVIHLNFDELPKDLMMVEIEISDALPIEEADLKNLNERWNEFPTNPATQKVGDEFVRNNKKVSLKVPSSVVQGDFNYLINTQHTGFKKIQESISLPVFLFRWTGDFIKSRTMRKIYALVFLLLTSTLVIAQDKTFTRQDSLRGGITPEREWWDLVHYDLDVTVDPDTQSLKGSNIMTYKVLKSGKRLQIDLQAPMKLTLASQDGQKLKVENEGSAHFITLRAPQNVGATKKIDLLFEGTPIVAQNPPWDGGWTWKQDSKGKTFAANANQGIGASVWWPNKDIPYDKVKSLDLKATVPQGVMAVSNGRLIDSTKNAAAKTTTYHWQVENPINNYGVNINIADYAHFADTYNGEKGVLDLDFYVLKENLAKAKTQFEQVPDMLDAFEYWFGSYPFYEDGYKLVEVPYLGMEHQSSVTYGNNYENGYLGRDLSGTGWGLKFDFIIIHESGHEWFANNITNKDVADMWLHEGFTAYSENLFLDYHYGKQASSEYVLGTRRTIRNDRPIIGYYGVDREGSGDMYYKGANLLHSLRQIVNDDVQWRTILRGLNKTFYHQTVTTIMIENYIAQQSKLDLKPFWDQYLRTTMIPTLTYKIQGNTLSYKYDTIVEGFDLPVIMLVDGREIWLKPKNIWMELALDKTPKTLSIKPDFYVNGKQIK